MIPKTAAGRMQMIHDLLDTNVYADDGITVIGQKEPLITPEMALKLMNMSLDESEED